MASSRSARRERQRQRERAEAEAAERSGYFLCGVIALAGPFVGLLHGGLAALSLGTLFGLAVAAFYFWAARARRPARLDPAAIPATPSDSPFADYERSLADRARQDPPALP